MWFVFGLAENQSKSKKQPLGRVSEVKLNALLMGPRTHIIGSLERVIGGYIGIYGDYMRVQGPN